MDNATDLPADVNTRPSPSPQEIRKQRQTVAVTIILALIVVGIFVTSLVFLLNPNLTNADTVSRIRDVFIIFMALESLLIGLVLIILIVQIARLTNLLQNEIKPILDTTSETVNDLRGTTRFLSNNLIEPVIKLNEYIAIVQKFGNIVSGKRRQ